MFLPNSNRYSHTALLLSALFLILGASACSSKAQKADRAPTERRVLQTNAPAPTKEVLKDSPCGNPDWAKPPGTAGDEPADADFRATTRVKPADEPTEPTE